MKYLKAAQSMPGKGTSWMLYEIEGENKVVRVIIHTPDIGEIKVYPEPKLKRLASPQLCEQATKEEFDYLWDTAMDLD